MAEIKERCKTEKEKCNFWVAKKRRFCSISPLDGSLFCGNHLKREDGQWVPCSIDPSHSVLKEKLEKHIKKCPSVKQARSLSAQPYYQKGINCVHDLKDGEEEDLSSDLKRKAVHSMPALQFTNLLNKIKATHEAICGNIPDSYKSPNACDMWIKGEVDRKIPYEEKHVLQQASILGNLEEFGVLKNSSKMSQRDHFDSSHSPEGQNDVPAVIEFGAGRGYLTQTLADCYGIKRVLLVERKAYKLKADRSLRQKDQLQLERLRIDIEDLNLNAVESLKGVSYLAIGKHLCGPATDLTLRCCITDNSTEQGSSPRLCGLAIATCCHHLCQWKHYTNKAYLSTLGISKEDFHAMTWFTSWAVDAKHDSVVGLVEDSETLNHIGNEDEYDENSSGLEEIKKMNAADRAAVGFMCKDIIDMGRLMWIKEREPKAAFVNYVPKSISPENHLLVAKHCCNHS